MSEFSKKKFLIMLIAPSAGGKSTVLQKILSKHSDIAYSVSYTTRKPRGTEKNGEAYHFVNEPEFKKMIEHDDFLEYANVHGNWYGTSKSFIEKKLSEGKHVIMDVDVQGAFCIMESGFGAVTVFLLPPTQQELRKRLINRGTDSEEAIALRLTNAESEIDCINRFDYLVINDDLDKAVSEVEQIICAEENKVNRYCNIKKNFYRTFKEDIDARPQS